MTEELQDLAHDLREREQPLALATDALEDPDSKPGLVAVTSERLLYVYSDPEDDRNDIWNETERGELSEVEAAADDEGRPRLSFTIDATRRRGVATPSASAT